MKDAIVMTSLGRTILVTLVLALFVFPQPVSAKIIIKAAQSNSETHPVGIGLINFAKRVQELTGGEIEVKLFHSAALGGEREIIEATQLGQIEIGTATMGVVANFAPELDIISLPFLFNGYDHIQKVLAGPELKPVFEAAVKKVGLVSLGSSTGGIRQVYSKKPLRSIEDFKGIKIRTMEVPTIISTFRALQTNPVPMSVGEVYSGLQSGVIDACESSFLTWINSRHYEVSKYGIQINYMDSGRSYVANQKFMERLDPKLRKAIEQAMTESIEIIVREYKSQDADAVKTAQRIGAEILTPDLKPFIAAVQPVYKQFTPTLGLKMIETIQKAQ